MSDHLLAQSSNPPSGRSREPPTSRGLTAQREAPSSPGRGSAASLSGSLLAATAAPSPHYATSLRSRHSLYGIEDRIVLDLGSAVWKAGFSGEPSPRICTRPLKGSFGEDGSRELGLWSLDKCERDTVQWEIREERLKRELRMIWFE